MVLISCIDIRAVIKQKSKHVDANHLFSARQEQGGGPREVQDLHVSATIQESFRKRSVVLDGSQVPDCSSVNVLVVHIGLGIQ